MKRRSMICPRTCIPCCAGSISHASCTPRASSNVRWTACCLLPQCRAPTPPWYCWWARCMQVLFTDHHLAGAHLPEADAIVNPYQPGDMFASKSLAVVVVIFYVMLALRARLRAEQWFARSGIEQPNLAQLLDLVALGTEADVVPLDFFFRFLV